MTTIEELKEELGFKTKLEFDEFMTDLFKLKNVITYRNSSAKKRYENALCRFYDLVKLGGKNIKTGDSEEVQEE